MQRCAVINVVGLTGKLMGPSAPRIRQFAEQGSVLTIKPAFPAVTCTAQSNYLTGCTPSKHGIVANGWYHRELAEVQFWKQSNHIVRAPKIWEVLKQKNADFSCANTFWWYNMYSSADYSITPRPMYPADGRKVFDVYTWPYSIRTDIKKALGEFPFFGFWGPAAGVDSPQGRSDATSRWIADAARWIENRYQPTLHFVYLPHLDYNLQRFGPDDPCVERDIAEIDAIVGGLVDFFRKAEVQVSIVSEYGIVPVRQPVHLNRLFREKGWLTVKDELGLELLDPGNSRAFAVADHQVAHIYVNDPSILDSVRTTVEASDGVAKVLGLQEKPAWGMDHERSGDLIALAAEDAWFTYYYWLDDEVAPDFARTVDIHRKPGYDPVELFIDPEIAFPKVRILSRLLRKKLGFRMLMDVIPLNAGLVRGSHGVQPANDQDWPVLLTEKPMGDGVIESTEISSILQKLVMEK